MDKDNIKYQLLAHQMEHEKTLSRLYKSYYDLFPEIDTWEKLYLEEKKHAAWIQQLIVKVCDGTIFFNDRIDCCEDIQKSIERMNVEIEKAEKKEIDKLHAFKVSIEIETSMIEREFFRSLDSDAPFVEEVLDKIKNDTERHKDSLISAKNEFLESIK